MGNADPKANYGVKLTFKDGDTSTAWYSTTKERDVQYDLAQNDARNPANLIKNVKKVRR